MFLSFLTGCCRREPHHPPWYSGTTRGCRGRATWWCKDWTCPATCLWRLTLSSLLMCAHHLHPPPTRPSSPVPPGWQHRGPGTGEEEGIVRRRTGGCELVPPARTLPCSTLGPSAVHAGSSDLTGACAGCCSTGSGCQPLLCRSCSSPKTDLQCSAQHVQEMRAVQDSGDWTQPVQGHYILPLCRGCSQGAVVGGYKKMHEK